MNFYPAIELTDRDLIRDVLTSLPKRWRELYRTGINSIWLIPHHGFALLSVSDDGNTLWCEEIEAKNLVNKWGVGCLLEIAKKQGCKRVALTARNCKVGLVLEKRYGFRRSNLSGVYRRMVV